MRTGPGTGVDRSIFVPRPRSLGGVPGVALGEEPVRHRRVLPARCARDPSASTPGSPAAPQGYRTGSRARHRTPDAISSGADQRRREGRRMAADRRRALRRLGAAAGQFASAAKMLVRTAPGQRTEALTFVWRMTRSVETLAERAPRASRHHRQPCRSTRDQPGHRGRVDDVALVAAGRHARHEAADAVDDAPDVDAQQPLPVGQTILPGRALAADDAGVVATGAPRPTARRPAPPALDVRLVETSTADGDGRAARWAWPRPIQSAGVSTSAMTTVMPSCMPARPGRSRSTGRPRDHGHAPTKLLHCATFLTNRPQVPLRRTFRMSSVGTQRSTARCIEQVEEGARAYDRDALVGRARASEPRSPVTR
jgi:hypothetical protein